MSTVCLQRDRDCSFSDALRASRICDLQKRQWTMADELLRYRCWFRLRRGLKCILCTGSGSRPAGTNGGKCLNRNWLIFGDKCVTGISISKVKTACSELRFSQALRLPSQLHAKYMGSP